MYISFATLALFFFKESDDLMPPKILLPLMIRIDESSVWLRRYVRRRNLCEGSFKKWLPI